MRNTRREQVFTALPSTTDILAGRLRDLGSKSNTARDNGLGRELEGNLPKRIRFCIKAYQSAN